MASVDPAAFRYELQVRGLTWRELLKLTGLSKPTMANVSRGREVSVATLRRVHAALDEYPRMESIAGAIRLNPDDTTPLT
jgi:transcriptional regulator with XRE-family HTH domain